MSSTQWHAMCHGCVGSVFSLVVPKLMGKLKSDGILDSMKYGHLFHATNSCCNREPGRQVSKWMAAQCGGGSRQIGLRGGGYLSGRVSGKASRKVLALHRRMHSVYQLCSAVGQALCKALTEETEVTETQTPHCPAPSLPQRRKPSGTDS